MAVKARGMTFGYQARPVLHGVDLDLGAGRFTALLGKNGCGKTTLLKCLAGLLRPRAGLVEVLGQDLLRQSAAARARLVGYLPQAHRPVFPFSVTDVVLTGRASQAGLLPKTADRAAAAAALERVGLAGLSGRIFTELSGGEQQMVLFARLLAQRPQVILLDEPTSHLDLPNQAKVLGLVKELVAGGLTVVAVLHDPNQAFLYADEMLFLRRGQVVALAPGQKPWDRDVLRAAYGVELETAACGDQALVLPRLRPPGEPG